jgi:tagatose 1,6-diphosphate aldolase
MTTFGLHRRLAQCSDAARTFSVLALDHRDNLVADIQKHRPDTPVTFADVRAFKADILRAVDVATGTLLDPDYGMPALTHEGVPGHIGLLAPLEVTDYRPHPSQRQMRLIPDWGVASMVASGVSGAKLLVFFHPDAADAASKTALVDELAESCRAHDLPLFLEPIVYPLKPEVPLSSDERRRVVIESARHFSRRGATVMKMECPFDASADDDPRVWAEAFRQLDAACAGPWTLLSAGVGYDVFLRQAVLACQAGASGVIAGRAVWAEACGLSAADRPAFVETVVRPRLAKLTAVCRALATPWTKRLEPPDLPKRWYAR